MKVFAFRVLEALVVGILASLIVVYFLHIRKPNIDNCSGTWVYKQSGSEGITGLLVIENTGRSSGRATFCGVKNAEFVGDTKDHICGSVKGDTNNPNNFQVLTGIINLEDGTANFVKRTPPDPVDQKAAPWQEYLGFVGAGCNSISGSFLHYFDKGGVDGPTNFTLTKK